MKTICFDRLTKSHWQSCRTIKSNIRKSLELTGDIIEYISIDECEGDFRISALCKRIQEEKITKIIFIEHQYIPIDFICSLKELVEFLDIDLYFFIYGDFSLNLNSWQTLAHNLIGAKAKFLVASKAQKNLVSKVIKGSIEIAPFPVDANQFHFDMKERKAFRQQLGLIDEPVFFYSGRVSEQKNVLELIHSFINIKKHYFKNAKLFISGNYDDIGKAFFGKKNLPGYFYQRFQSELEKLDEHIRNDIVFFDFVPNDQMMLLYNASDFYLSLSSFHDEDYGMSVAEALMCGLPCLVTDWGGYSSFKQEVNKKYIQLISVDLTTSGPRVNFREVLKKFLFLHSTNRAIDRSLISEAAKSLFSTESVAKRFKDLIFSSKPLKRVESLGYWASVINEHQDGDSTIFISDGVTTDFYRDMYNDYR